ADSRQTLVRDLAADGLEPAPLFYMGYEGAFYAGLMKQMRMQEQREDAPVDEHADEAGAAIAARAGQNRKEFEMLMAPLLVALDELYTAFSYVAVELVVTERGLEVRQSMAVD
ncbi:MAG: hypothetical protein WCZ02_11510, partial [Lysobacterales bacterium]